MVRVQNQPTLRVYDTGTITCTTTTDTQATEVITGEIIKVEIIASASSNFKILTNINFTCIYRSYLNKKKSKCLIVKKKNFFKSKQKNKILKIIF